MSDGIKATPKSNPVSENKYSAIFRYFVRDYDMDRDGKHLPGMVTIHGLTEQPYIETGYGSYNLTEEGNFLQVHIGTTIYIIRTEDFISIQTDVENADEPS